MKRYVGKKIGSIILSTALIIGILQPVETSAKTGIKLSASSVTLTAGKVKTVKVKGTSKVNWSVSGKAIKVIKRGNKSIQVKGVKVGKATIFAKIKSKKYTCKVNVTAARDAAKPTIAPSESAEAKPTTAPSESAEALPTATPNQEALSRINMTVQEYRSDTNTITVRIDNNTSGQVIYGRMFGLERYENSKWTTVPFADDIAFTADAIVLPPGGKSTEVIPLDVYFGVLSSGKYRIVKTVHSEAISKEGILLCAEFDVAGEQVTVSAEPGTATEAPVRPTETPVQPTEAPVRPTAGPVQPTVAPVQPTEAPIQVSLPPATTYQPEDYKGEIPLRRGTENGEVVANVTSRAYSMMSCLPVGMESQIISDVQELEEVKRSLETIVTNCINDPASFILKQLTAYDEEYFQENSLVLGTCEWTYGYSVVPEQVIVDGNKIICKLQVEWTAGDMSVPCVMMSHVILNELPKNELPKSEVGGCESEIVIAVDYNILDTWSYINR